MTDQLHEQVKAAVEEIRRRFNKRCISEFRLDIECRGRVEGGEPKISYKLSAGYYSSEDSTTGARLAPVLEEQLRRHEWLKRNDPPPPPALSIVEDTARQTRIAQLERNPNRTAAEDRELATLRGIL